MEVKGRFDHFNFNVLDLDKSIRFYEEALGLKEVRRMEASDGSFILVYMGEEKTGFLLELTWLRDRKEPYDLGEGEFHLCMRVPGDYDAVRAYHKQMDCVCYENTDMGLYFISDPGWLLDRDFAGAKIICSSTRIYRKAFIWRKLSCMAICLHDESN